MLMFSQFLILIILILLKRMKISYSFYRMKITKLKLLLNRVKINIKLKVKMSPSNKLTKASKMRTYYKISLNNFSQFCIVLKINIRKFKFKVTIEILSLRRDPRVNKLIKASRYLYY